MKLLENKHINVLFFLLIGLVNISSCDNEDADTKELCVRYFSQHYFNLRYQQALAYCTDSSKKWIEYKASNISQTDLDVINSQTDTAVCNIDNIEIREDGKRATAYITINNVLVCDTIGRNGRMRETLQKTIALKKQAGKWYVDLNCPL